MSAFVSTGVSSRFAQSAQSAPVCRKSGAMKMAKDDSRVYASPEVNKKEIKKEVVRSGPTVNPSGEGFFGFTAFSETWNGRLSMIGLVAAVVNELRTGEGILGQLGIPESQGLNVALVILGLSTVVSGGYILKKKADQVDRIASDESKNF
eukprot:CAMPEP_0185830630 /NCGR_PEP_ID=MMETSP1353-20130828/986_1 /TAXON_ID=1077150 /ORGANISM="Erythrolobus australicus, Strain CCMP3124" /LENGTH=149 /DNA_ID=CAMNT_0028528587 /DNA_START=150 /DNA_END=599 /DNA_ORIENTATION=+